MLFQHEMLFSTEKRGFILEAFVGKAKEMEDKIYDGIDTLTTFCEILVRSVT